MFDNNNQEQQQTNNPSNNPAAPADPVASPAEPPAPPAGSTLGFSGNAIDNESSLVTSVTPLTGTPPVVAGPASTSPPPSNPAMPTTPPAGNDSGVSLPNPQPNDQADSVTGSTPLVPDELTPSPPPADTNQDNYASDSYSGAPQSSDSGPADNPAVNSSAQPDATGDQAENHDQAPGEPNFDLPELEANNDEPHDSPTTDNPTDSEDNTNSDDGNQSPSDTSTDGLKDIKQQALQQLSPLVSHLDQTPEEKFHTTMMMIQATDDETLIPSAYTTAQKISDEKAKAQALLELINEINYFTGRANNSGS